MNSIHRSSQKFHQSPNLVRLSANLSASEGRNHQNRIAMDTSEFERIAFLAGTVSRKPPVNHVPVMIDFPRPLFDERTIVFRQRQTDSSQKIPSKWIGSKSFLF